MADTEELRHDTKLALDSAVNSSGRFEVDTISAGSGNGWQFSAEVLQESLALWDNAECFVDHSWMRSVRDLGGYFKFPRWSPENQSIRMDLYTFGPSGEMVDELGRQMLTRPVKSKPKVGFSADVTFTAEGKNVTRILKVNSVDLVYNPPRGGAFVRALNSQAEVNDMENQEEYNTLSAQVTAMREEQTALGGALLESTIKASALPEPAQALIRSQFQGRPFAAADLQAAIDAARKLITDLTGPASVQGARVLSDVFERRPNPRCRG